MVLNDLVDSFCYSQKNAGLKGLRQHKETHRDRERERDRERASGQTCVAVVIAETV